MSAVRQLDREEHTEIPMPGCVCRMCVPAREANREKHLALVAAWTKANPERRREQQRANYQANRDAKLVAMKERNASRRRFLQSLKMEKGCIDCGYRDDPAKLHFDHRDGTLKLFNPSHGSSRSWSKMLAEIAKCDVRCNPCHQRRHGAETRM